MPTYKIGDKTVRRKNLYMPCIISDRVNDMSEEELAEFLKATYWSDYIANSEWPAVLQHDDCSPSARSRLKKKAAGWLVALQRIAKLNPELFEEIADRADRTYREQIEEEPVVFLAWEGRLFVGGQPTLVGAPVDWHPEVADTPQSEVIEEQEAW